MNKNIFDLKKIFVNAYGNLKKLFRTLKARKKNVLLLFVTLLLGWIGFLVANEKEIPLVNHLIYKKINALQAGFNKVCGLPVALEMTDNRYNFIVRGDLKLTPEDKGFKEFSQFIINDLKSNNTEFYANIPCCEPLSFEQFKKRAIKKGFSQFKYVGIPGDGTGINVPLGNNEITAYLNDSNSGDYGSFFVYKIREGIEKQYRSIAYAWASLIFYLGLFIQIFQFDWTKTVKHKTTRRDQINSSKISPNFKNKLYLISSLFFILANVNLFTLHRIDLITTVLFLIACVVILIPNFLNLLPLIKRIRIWEFELELTQDIDKLKGDVSNFVKDLETKEGEHFEAESVQEFLDKTKGDPKGTLLLLASEIEKEIRKKIVSIQSKEHISLGNVLDLGVKHEIFPQNIVPLFKDFWAIRNKIAHDYKFEVSDAYIWSVISLGADILQIIKNLKSLE